MTTLFVSAQVALPDWVRGRGLAIFLTVYFGAMTLGSALWGKVASVEGLPTALYLAAAGAFLGLIVTWGRKLQTAAALDLSPAMHWRSPVFVRRVEDDEGPILVTVEYRIDPEDRAPFLAAMQEIGLERKRDGSFAWNVFEDAAASRAGGRDVPDPVAARTEASARARHRGGPRGRTTGAQIPARAAESDVSRRPRRGRARTGGASPLWRRRRRSSRWTRSSARGPALPSLSAICRAMRRRTSSSLLTRLKRSRAPTARKRS